MRAALYIRVSTEEQNLEGYSISAQKNRCTSFVESQEDWELSHVYADPGYSAKDLKRPAVEQLIEGVKNKEFDVVVVYRLDRLVRSVLDLHKLLGLFDKHNVKFKSVTEVFDTTTAMGRFFITIVGAMAEWERSNLGERVRFGMSQKVREGGWHGSAAPYGYDLQENKLIINEEQAKYIQWIYKWYTEGMSDRKIAIRLNDMGVSTKTGTDIWREARIRYMLRNPLYYGSLRWGVRVNQEQGFEVEDAAPAIIDKELFEQAQRTREGRANLHPRRATSPYIFSGAVRCARCGAGFKGHKARGHLSYRCINRYEKKCDMPMVSEKMLEAAFIRYFRKVDPPSENPTPAPDNLNEIERLEKELADIKRRRKKWQYAWANEMMDDDEYQERMKEERTLEYEVKKELDGLVGVKEELPPEHVNIIGQYIEENWEELSQQEKKVFVQNTIEKMIIDKVDAKSLKDRAKILDIQFK
jgi:site-specific DNA recombinase